MCLAFIRTGRGGKYEAPGCRVEIPFSQVRKYMKKSVVLAVLAAAAAWAQSEGALRAYFEGRPVRAKMDLPGSHLGLDVNYRQTPPINYQDYQKRLNEWGPGAPRGVNIVVTSIRVKGKNIEFQLGGGGNKDTNTYVDFPTAVPKSDRERDYERELRDTDDRRRRDFLRSEIDRLRDRREREERRLRAEKVRLEEMKIREVRERAMRMGSRINLWFPNNYLKESVPTPQELMRMLDEYIDFSPMGGRMSGPPPVQSQPRPQQRYEDVPPPPPPPDGPQSGGNTGSSGLRRGLTQNEVYSLLGRPAKFRERREGTLTLRTEIFESRTESVEVDFTEGVVVRWRVSSK